jgi:hypothetical protein
MGRQNDSSDVQDFSPVSGFIRSGMQEMNVLQKLGLTIAVLRLCYRYED